MGGGQPTGSPVEHPLNVLILYDRRSLFTNTVREHVESFSRFSRHRVVYAHAAADGPLTFSLDHFDVVILHYSIRIAYPDFISAEFAWAIKPFKGLKALFIQDEYDNTWRACQWIEQLGIRLVFTCVPMAHVRSIYSKVDHDRVKFIQNLTGYLPTDSNLGRYIKPLSQRRTVIAYRGRPLPFRYGKLGREKLLIGVRMKQECEARGIPNDIAWTEEKRIYGEAWIEFVASCRATLGTESGSNVFDFDGSLSTALSSAIARNPSMKYEEAESRFLAGRELDGVMNQVSPRIFEAVALRTGLILFDGTYSGVVRPEVDFIPLRKDFSNVDEVLRRVQDDREVEAMTERAYRNVIESGAYTYQAFIRMVDDALSQFAVDHSKPELPATGDWTRDLQLKFAKVYATRTSWLGIGRRIVRRIGKFAFRYSGFKTALTLRQVVRWINRLDRTDPVFREYARHVRASKELRQVAGSRLRSIRERLRLAILRYESRECPNVSAPVWTSIRYEPTNRRIVFTTHPVHTMPDSIVDGSVELDRAIDAVRQKSVAEIVWEHPLTKAEMGKLGSLRFIMGSAQTFHFTTLERLADLEPERAARMLAHVGEGVNAVSATPTPESELNYRQAS